VKIGCKVWIPYLLVYESTFYDQKIALDLYTSHTQRPDQAVREISKTTAWSALGKPVQIAVDFNQFLAHSSSTKNCEIINVKWFKRRPTGDYFYCVFWSVYHTFLSRFVAFYSAELWFSSNDYYSLVTWQMLSFQYSSNSYFGYQVFQDGGAFIERSFEALRCYVPLVFLSKSPFKLNIEIKGS